MRFEKYFKLKSKKLSRKARVITLLMIMILLAASILIVKREDIHEKIYKTMGTSIRDWVSKETQGLYIFKYDSMEISTLKGQIKLKNISFHPDSVVLESKRRSNTLPKDIYKITSPQLFLEISSIWAVLFEDKLDFSGIKITHPDLTIFNLRLPDTTSNVSVESGNLYMKINNYLDVFNIRDFQLIDGRVNYKRFLENDKREYSIDNIDVYIDNLQIDATEKTTETDRVRVILRKPSFMLADKVHRVEMDSLLIDSKNQRLILNEVVVFPIYNKLQTEDIDQINLYNFNIPNIIVEGIDFTTAYRENTLNIKKIHIPNPEFIFDTHKKPNSSKKIDQKGLAKQLAMMFNTIHTEELLIEDAKMDLALEANNKLRNVRIEKTTIHIRDFDLDTIKYTTKNNHINFRSFDLNMREYHLILPDSIHQMTAESIVYSSDSSLLSVSEIQIDPSDKIFANQNRFNAHIPLIQLHGFEVGEYLRSHSLDFDHIVVNNPKIILHNPETKDSVSAAAFNFHLKNNKLTEFVTADKISVTDLDFELRQSNALKSRLTGGTIVLSNFNLNQTLPVDENIFANSSHVGFHLPELKLVTGQSDEITLTGVRGSLPRHNLALDNFEFLNADNTIRLNGGNIQVKGTHLLEILNNKNIEIDSLRIGTIMLSKSDKAKAQKVTNVTDKKEMPVKINFLSLDDGQVVLSNDTFSLNIDGIKGYLNELSLTTDGITATDKKLYTGKVLYYSEEKNLRIGATRAELLPDKFLLFLPYLEPIDKSDPNAITVNATQAAVLDFNIQTLLNDKKLHVGQFKLLSTEVTIHNDGEGSSDKNKQKSIVLDWNKILENKLQEIIIDRFIVSGPQLSFGTAGGELSFQEYELELAQFNTNTDGSVHLLNSDNVRIKCVDLLYSKDDLNISAGEFALDENKRQITFNSFLFENNSTRLEIPLIFANNMDLKLLAEENKFIGDELDIAGFHLTHKQDSTVVEKTGKQDSSSLPLIHFEQLNAHEGVVKYINSKGDELKINNIRWQLTNFDTEKNADKPLYSSRLNVRAGTLTGMINNNLDKLLVEGITFSDNGRTLHIDHFFLKPEFDKLRYAYEVGHETDWISLAMDDIHFTGIDIKRMFDPDPAFIINKGVITSISASIYRDKKLPSPEPKVKPLPQEALRKLDFPLAIDTFQIRAAEVKYQELNELAFEPGELQFSNMHINIFNITNMDSRLEKSQKMTATINGSIEGTDIYTQVIFDLLSPKNEFVFSGSMGEGDLVKFNKILENNVFIKIESGNSKGMTFNLRADNTSAYGKMQFHYKNLKVSLIDKQTNKTSGFDESVISFIANTFVIHNNNPSLFVLKEGNIYFNRDNSKSIFNYWAKSFLSGVLSSIGMKSNKKELKEALSEQE